LEISNASAATQTYAAKIYDSNRKLYKCSWWRQSLANQLPNFLVLLAMYREILVLLSNGVIKLPAPPPELSNKTYKVKPGQRTRPLGCTALLLSLPVDDKGVTTCFNQIACHWSSSWGKKR
jgi:hypothetical protein